MGYNPGTQEFEMITLQNEGKARGWTKFIEGENLSIKGVVFVVNSIEPNRLILRLFKAEKG